MPGTRCVVDSCSNIADLNTGVSLHSSPVLKESARCLLVILRSVLNTLKYCLALGVQYRVQYRCLDINGKSSQGRFRTYGKILEKKKNNLRKSDGKSKRTKSKSTEEDRKQQVSHLKTTKKLELSTAYKRNKTDNVLGKYRH